MNRSNLPAADPASIAADARVVRLTTRLLMLIPAGFVGFVVSSFLLMGADSCRADSTTLLCSTAAQWWIVWLPPIGAAIGMAAGGTLGAVLSGRGRPVGAGIALGWWVFAAAEFTTWILLRN
ncbi:hypothetical protein [Amycolatopsis sp. RTGN1]|uniref:hypothetical protein n=1 Tax=Amycolatopsis ponsaeliensis TaxID=2992142 RepID=UPI00254FE8CC|nr:hypothetical protein [Amycolatopsis sp. RTGN1]